MASTTFIPSHVSHQNSFGRYRHVPGRNTADAYLAQQATRTSPATTSPSSTSSQSSFQKQAPVGGIRIAFCPPPVTAVSQQQQQQYEFNAHDDQSDPRHILAERFRTKLCRNYVSSSTTTISQLPDGSMTSVLSGGHCPYESRCMFAHGDHELRTAAMNIQDGLFTEDAIKAFKRAHRMAVREERDRAYQQQQMSMAPPSYDYAVATSSSASAAFVAVSAPQPIYNEEEVYSQEDAVGVSSYVAEDADDDARSLAGSFYGDDYCGCDYNNAAAPAVPAYRHNPYGLSSLYQNAVPESSSVACLSKNKEVPMVDAAPKRFIHAMP